MLSTELSLQAKSSIVSSMAQHGTISIDFTLLVQLGAQNCECIKIAQPMTLAGSKENKTSSSLRPPKLSIHQTEI